MNVSLIPEKDKYTVRMKERQEMGRREMGDGGVLDDCGQQKDKTKGLGQKIENRVSKVKQQGAVSGGAAAKETMEVDCGRGRGSGCGCGGCGMDRQKIGTKKRLTAEMDCQPRRLILIQVHVLYSTANCCRYSPPLENLLIWVYMHLDTPAKHQDSVLLQCYCCRDSLEPRRPED
jgi:hypothetical protein